MFGQAQMAEEESDDDWQNFLAKTDGHTSSDENVADHDLEEDSLHRFMATPLADSESSNGDDSDEWQNHLAAAAAPVDSNDGEPMLDRPLELVAMPCSALAGSP